MAIYGVQRAKPQVPRQTYLLGLGGELAKLPGFADYCESCGYHTFILEGSPPFCVLNGISSRNDSTIQAVLEVLRGGFDALCEVAKSRSDA